MSDELVRIKGVTVAFDGEVVLDKVDFSVHEDDYIGVIGPNGGGKTTLLKVILGLVKPVEGTISVMGIAPEQGRKFVGYVPQHPEFDQEFPISVRDIVLMGRLSKKARFRAFGEDDRRMAQAALEQVGIPHLRNRQISKLSGGERQRVYIARALVSDPRILLLDEPTANIDVEMEVGFYELLNRLRERIAIVLVSHDVTAISVNVEKIACLNKQLFVHDASELNGEVLEKTYKCPVEMIAHGVPHRVLKKHK